MDNMTLPIIIFVSFPEAILVCLLGMLLLGIRPTMKQIIIFSLVQAVFSFAIRSLPVPFGIHSLLQLFTFSLLIYFIVSIPYKITLITVFLGTSIYGIVETVSIPILLNLSGLTLQSVLSNQWLRIAFFIPEAMVLIFCIYLIRRYNLTLPEKLLNYVGAKKRNKADIPLVGVFLIQTYLFTLLIIINFVANNYGFSMQHFVATNIFIFLLTIGLTIILFKRTLRLIHEDTENKNQLQTLQHVEELIKTVRSQRHNFCHDLQVVYGLIELEEFHEARKYIESVMHDVSITSELVKTDNLGVTALLLTKIGIAESKNIKINFDIKASLKKLPLETRHLNMILGNLIDNALDAVNSLPLEQRVIEIEISQEIDGIVMKVKNYGQKIEEYIINKIFEAGVSTKGDDRGMGLYSITKLLEKCNGKISVESDLETIFKVTLPVA